MGAHIIRLQKVKQVTGLSRSAIYKLISKGQFPKQIKLGARASGWLESEIDDWIAARVAERDGKAA